MGRCPIGIGIKAAGEMDVRFSPSSPGSALSHAHIFLTGRENRKTAGPDSACSQDRHGRGARNHSFPRAALAGVRPRRVTGAACVRDQHRQDSSWRAREPENQRGEYPDGILSFPGGA